MNTIALTSQTVIFPFPLDLMEKWNQSDIILVCCFGALINPEIFKLIIFLKDIVLKFL